MIWVRRTFAVFLAIFFLFFFLVALVALRVNSTALSASFVKSEVRKADLFNFAYDRLIPAAMDQEMPDLPLGMILASKDVVRVAKQVAPPDWLETQTEEAIDQVWPYLTGTKDSFTIRIPLSDRVKAAGPAAKDLLRSSGVYTIATKKEFAEEIDKALKGRNDPNDPLQGLPITGQQVATAVQRIAPPEWVQQQVEQVIDQAVPYISGDKDSFKITVPVKDRIEAAGPAIKDLLRDAKAYDYVFEQMLVPMVTDNLGEMTQLPFGVTITDDEVVEALRQVVPPDWLREQVERAIDAVIPYATGRATTFQVVIPLSDRIDTAGRVVRELADRKLKQLYDSLPICTANQVLEMAKSGLSGIPSCRPGAYSLEQIKAALGITTPGVTLEQLSQLAGMDLSPLTRGVTYDDFKRMTGINIGGAVDQFVVSALPKGFTFREADLRKMMGASGEKYLDDGLKVIREGVTYTDVDLRRDLAKRVTDFDAVGRLDEVRDTVRGGLTFTEADLREQLSKDDPDALEQLDQTRSALGTFKRLVPLAYLAGTLILALIGFLGGRHLASKVRWAAVALAIPSLAAFIITGPVYSGVAKPLIDEMLSQATEGVTGVELLATEKGISVGKTVINDFVSGINTQALAFFILALVAIAVSIVLPRVLKKPATQEAVTQEKHPGQQP